MACLSKNLLDRRETDTLLTRMKIPQNALENWLASYPSTQGKKFTNIVKGYFQQYGKSQLSRNKKDTLC